jgi:hypothetical protein
MTGPGGFNVYSHGQGASLATVSGLPVGRQPGALGIGTTTPAAMLHVAGPARANRL